MTRPRLVDRIGSRIADTRALAASGADPRSKAVLAGLGMTLPLWRRLPPPRRASRVRVRVIDREFLIAIGDWSDVLVVADVLTGQYDLGLPPHAATVVDVGANIGVSSLWLHRRFPNATVLACEPHPRTFARLKANVAPVSAIRPLRVAVGGRDGTAILAEDGGAWEAELADDGSRGFEVDVVTLAALIRRAGIDHVDVLKIDIEGAEYDVFRSLEDFNAIGCVVGECHAWKGRFTREEFAALFPPSWSIRFEVVGRDLVFVARPS